MSIQKIKKYLKEVKDNEGSLSWVDEEVALLLMSIAEHLIDLAKEHEVEPPAVENMITAKEFERRYGYISYNTLQRYLNTLPDFSSKCAFFNGKKWYLNPDVANAYLLNIPTFKKRLERFSKNC